MDGLTLITPTSDRLRPFALCEKWMKRALRYYSGDNFQWIVADSGMTPVDCTLGQQHVHLAPVDNPKESFRRNLLAALRKVEHEIILFIEDDDWYAEQYLTKMYEWLTGNIEIAGEARARYYFLPTQRYHFCRNREHASLCQTGIRSCLLPWLIQHLERNPNNSYIDIALWQEMKRRGNDLLHPRSTLTVGMKGLPGKAGIGMGHRLSLRHQHDPQSKILRHWVGDEDATIYESL